MNIVEPIRDMDKIKEIYQYLKNKNDRDALMFLFGIYTRIENIRYFEIQGKRLFKKIL